MWQKAVFLTVLLCTAIIASIAASQKTRYKLSKNINSSIATIITYDSSGNQLGECNGVFVTPDYVISSRSSFKNANRAKIITADKKVLGVEGVVPFDYGIGVGSRLTWLYTDTSYFGKFGIPLDEELFEGESVLVIGRTSSSKQSINEGIITSIRKVAEFGNFIKISGSDLSGIGGRLVLNQSGTKIIGILPVGIQKGQKYSHVIPMVKVYQEFLPPREAMRRKTISFDDWANAMNSNNPTDANPYFKYGLEYFFNQDYDKAIDILKKILAIYPQDIWARHLIAYCQDERGHPEEAKKTYRDIEDLLKVIAVKRVDDSLKKVREDSIKMAIEDSTRRELGREYLKRGDYLFQSDSLQEAIDVYEKAQYLPTDWRSLDDRLSRAYIQLAAAKVKIGAYDEALNAYVKGRRNMLNPPVLDKKMAKAYLEFGRLIMKDGKYMEAIEALNALEESEFAAEANYNIGIAYSYLGLYTSERSSYLKAIGKKPDYVDARYRLCLSFLGSGDKKSALEQYEILKKLDKKLADKIAELVEE